VSLFSYSTFLSEAVLKNPERILEVASSGSFYRVLTVDEYEERLFEFLGAEYLGVPSAVDLARFRRRQLLRIVLRDVLGVATLSDVTEELSNLADAILTWPTGAFARSCRPPRRAAPGRRPAVRLLGDLARQAGRARS
jgi:glutamate-ammonia-ligase adenylyltransferase